MSTSVFGIKLHHSVFVFERSTIGIIIIYMQIDSITFELLQPKFKRIEVKTEVRNSFTKKKVEQLGTENNYLSGGSDHLERMRLNLGEIFCHLLFP